ncbi:MULTISPECIES: ATP-binding protein [unclassified Microbacterium]|uniref:sensor histidine kinase n=1 Tax=unclassified Microbacterium TaxID=2609290 RepID=UPI00214BCEF6|nr:MULTISPECIES: ATP-binding protein [unclassified Microbacterium]MCR2784051.1 ATP-binding protein [Microbacterium sp. zg.B96]MDL5351031.1 ATP-binding protein [Microbacterium sp. zg-YB36]WIM15109.1 ATP-binding protein [Microbacterium sp. zg-B96]
MDSLQLALLALLVGMIVGVSVAMLIALALRARDRALAMGSSHIPEGVHAVLGGMEDIAVIVDASFTIVAASAAAQMFGMTEGVAVTSPELRALVRGARTTGRPHNETLRLGRSAPLAPTRLVTARASVVTPRLVLLIVRDISERERVEDMRRDFVANTSHELKTPVGAVMLLSEAIESAADDPAQVRAFAGRLHAEAARLGQLTGRILNLSRLQASDQLAEVRDVAIDQVVAAAIDAHQTQAEAAEVELVRGGDRGLFVRGDAQILAEAVGNLVANAIAYSPAGSRVGIGVKAVDGVVEIAVTDRGIGIPEGEQDRVFERFYRADQARSRRTGGTGLGLSIVKHAVQRHGGDVRLWSRPGQGSTFTIRLPRSEPPAPDAQQRKKRTRSTPDRAPVANGEHR